MVEKHHKVTLKYSHPETKASVICYHSYKVLNEKHLLLREDVKDVTIIQLQ